MRFKIPRTVAGPAAAALFLASFLVPAFAIAQDTHPVQRRSLRQVVRTAARDCLGLTAEQEKSLRDYRRVRREEQRSCREEMARLRAQLRDLARDPLADRSKIDALIDQMAGLRAEREKAAFRNRAERDKIFTPEQIDRLKRLRSRLAPPKRMARLRDSNPRPFPRRWRR